MIRNKKVVKKIYMKLLFLLCVFSTPFFSQETITFLRTVDDTTVRQIESEIIKNVFEMYNVKTESNLKYQFKNITPFPSIFSELKKAETSSLKHTLAGMNSISNTLERKQTFDFSSIYLPAFDVVFSLKETTADWNKKNTKISYHLGTTQETTFQRLKKEHEITGVPFLLFKDRLNSLFLGDVRFSLGDNVEVWDDKRFKVVHSMPYKKGTGFGIIYPKGSNLNARLDRYLVYYIKSAKFHTLIREKFGVDVSIYFRKNL